MRLGAIFLVSVILFQVALAAWIMRTAISVLTVPLWPLP